MSDYTPEDIVKYTISGDGSKVKEALQSVLADKIMTAIQDKKSDVAQSMFNSTLKQEPTEAE